MTGILFFGIFAFAFIILGAIALSIGEQLGAIALLLGVLCGVGLVVNSIDYYNEKNGSTAKNKTITIETEYTIFNGDTLVTNCDTTYVIKN